jgi:hypothetical protein
VVLWRDEKRSREFGPDLASMPILAGARYKRLKLKINHLAKTKRKFGFGIFYLWRFGWKLGLLLKGGQ